MSTRKIVLLVAVAVLLGLLAALRWMYTRDMARLDRHWQSLEQRAQARGRFDPAMVEGLPPLVREYLLQAIEPGAPLVDRIACELPGRFSPDGGESWIPMEGREIMAPREGFVWTAEAGEGLMRMSGGDYLVDGRGRVGFWLWGLIPVVSMGPSEEVGRSSAGRSGSEGFLCPPVLLPLYGTRWEQTSDSTATAFLESGGEPVELHFRFDESSFPEAVWLERWQADPQGGLVRGVFGGDLEGRVRQGGFTVPARMKAGWHDGSAEYAPFFEAAIRSLRPVLPGGTATDEEGQG